MRAPTYCGLLYYSTQCVVGAAIGRPKNISFALLQYSKGSDLMNTPNKLTLLRILLIPVFIISFFTEFRYSTVCSLIIFAVASITDSIDGYLARRNNQVTTFGQLMDPLADKILVTSALICFVSKGYVWAWAAILIISREFIVTGIRLLAVGEKEVIAASGWGKVKTVSQIVAIIVILAAYIPQFIEIQKIMLTISDFLIILTVALTIYSGFDYIRKNWHLLNFR